MPTTTAIPLPAAHALRKLGRDLALARRKRGLSTADMAVVRGMLVRGIVRLVGHIFRCVSPAAFDYYPSQTDKFLQSCPS